MTTPSTDSLIDIGKQALTQSVTNDEDFLPTVVLEYLDGQTHIVMLAVDGHPFDVLLRSAKDIVTGPLAVVSLTCDTYVWKGKAEDFDGGPLAPRFLGGDPNVSESLAICAAERGDDNKIVVTTTNLPYTRCNDLKGGRTVVWGEPITPEDAETEGRIPALMHALLFASQVLVEGDPELADADEQAIYEQWKTAVEAGNE